MVPQWAWMLIFLFVLLGLIAIAEYLNRGRGLPAEQSRKFLHVTGGLLCLLMPVLFISPWWVLCLSASSFLLLLITYLRHQLRSIHHTQRRSLGSILFPVPVYVCFLIASRQQDWLLFYLPVSLLTISDTAAEMGGQKWGNRLRQFFGKQKSLAGTISFFLTAIPILLCWLIFYRDMSWQAALLPGIGIAAGAAVAELCGLQGWDNITVPAVTMLLYVLMT